MWSHNWYQPALSYFLMIGRYQIYIIYVIAQMVPAGPIIFSTIGRYQIYVMDVSAQMVPAGRTIFPMIGRYRIYIMYAIAQMVPASPIINVCDRTTGTGPSYHIPHYRPIPDIHDV